MEFDNFQWLLSTEGVTGNRMPDETLYDTPKGYCAFRIEEEHFLKDFYAIYIHPFGLEFVQSKSNLLDNTIASAWLNFAIDQVDYSRNIWIERSKKKLKDIYIKLCITDNSLNPLFDPYLPFINRWDVFRFGKDFLEDDSMAQFYVLLIIALKLDFPKDLIPERKTLFKRCKEKGKCSLNNKCTQQRMCLINDSQNENAYSFKSEIIKHEQGLLYGFLQLFPKDKQQIAYTKFIEALEQVSQSGYFKTDKIVLADNLFDGSYVANHGIYFVPWSHVSFYDGYYLLKNPSTSNIKVKGCVRNFQHYRVDDAMSRSSFNKLNHLFMRKLMPICVEAKKGSIVKVFNKFDFKVCIELLEYSVQNKNVTKKLILGHSRTERRDLTVSAVRSLLKDKSTTYIDFLCNIQMNPHKVVCCFEHRVNASGTSSIEYSFIFTVKQRNDVLYLAYESAEKARCTYVFPIESTRWSESVDRLYTFFASNEVNKRQSMASRLINLELPGNYDYIRVTHSDLHESSLRINYIQYEPLSKG